MNDSIKIIRKEDQRTTSWSGGTTTQLAIFPENADYAARNFCWRISKATMDADFSTFTSLPGYWRLLMATGGQFTLQHENRHTAVLQPYEQDSFDGGWTTRCIGRGEDLNVMLASGWTAGMQCIAVASPTSVTVSADPGGAVNERFECFYPVCGPIRLRVGDGVPVELLEGELLVCRKKSMEPQANFVFWNPHPHEPSRLIRISIHP